MTEPRYSPWTPERRAAQAERIRAQKPWEHSTGPRTKSGKKRVSKNAVRHGEARAKLRMAKKALKLQREFMHLILPVLRDEELAADLAALESKLNEKPF